MSEKSLPAWYTRSSLPFRFTPSRICLSVLIVFTLLSAGSYKYGSFAPVQVPVQTAHDESTHKAPFVPSYMSASETPVLHTVPSMMSAEDAETMCTEIKLKPFPNRDRYRKVYDLFIVGTELDWLEIRLNTLAPFVDYFVIMESDKTFTNHTKPKYFKKNWKQFQKFESQIIYRVLDDDAAQNDGAWAREHYQRNALVTQVFPSLLGDQAPHENDVLIVSDVDEIPRPETISKLRNCEYPERTGLNSRFYLYSFQWHRSGEDWIHPQATFWMGQDTILPENLRMTETFYDFENASWHCTSCFSTVQELVHKVNSFSHQEWNKPEFKDPDKIVQRVRNGVDLFERGFPYEKFPQNELDVPEYLLQHRERFAYLLDRDPPNANFRDYVPRMGLADTDEIEDEYNW